MNESTMRASAPMIAGPRIVVPSMCAEGWIDTRPSICVLGPTSSYAARQPVEQHAVELQQIVQVALVAPPAFDEPHLDACAVAAQVVGEATHVAGRRGARSDVHAHAP